VYRSVKRAAFRFPRGAGLASLETGDSPGDQRSARLPIPAGEKQKDSGGALKKRSQYFLAFRTDKDNPDFAVMLGPCVAAACTPTSRRSALSHYTGA